MGKGKSDDREIWLLCGAMSFCCLIVILMLALLAYGIAKIVMGSVYLHDCSIERFIPIYLIVSGVAPIVFGGFGRRDDDEPNLSGNFCGVLGILFNVAWLICGSVWVYPNYGKLNDVDFTTCSSNKTTECLDEICDKDLMKFAISAVTIDWVFIGFWIVVIGYQLRKLTCQLIRK
ncbi:transmembrane protein 272-like isoform X2 [Mercenaria mercenaria]|nr:transmembrane protein 272-like isoform X2 [Mercenaria mercenaria]XP_045200410.2 transmembrane protein 272-like isoform X2 [Mercenaria mercenaria]